MLLRLIASMAMLGSVPPRAAADDLVIVRLDPPSPWVEVAFRPAQKLPGPITLIPSPVFDAFQQHFEPLELEAEGTGESRLRVTRDGNRWTVEGELTELRYRVRLDRRSLAIVQQRGDQYASSSVTEDHAMVFTSELFLLPEAPAVESLTV